MARRNRPTRTRVQRPKSALPVRLERALHQIMGDATEALIYMSTERRSN